MNDLLATYDWACAQFGTRNVGHTMHGETWIPEVRGRDQWVEFPVGVSKRDMLQVISILRPDYKSY